MTQPTTNPKLRYTQTAGYYLVSLAFGFIIAVWGPILPSLAAQTGVNLAQIGIVFTANALGFLLGSLLGGRLYDSLPGHRVVLAALAVVTLGFVLIPLIPTLWMLCVLALVISTANGTIVVGCNTLLARVNAHNVSPWLNALHFFNGAGAFLSPIAVARVLDTTGSITWALWGIALSMLLSAGWIALVVSPPIPPHTTLGAESRPPWPILLPIALTFVLYVGAEQSYSGWLFSYAAQMYGTSDLVGGLLTSAFWGALTIGRLLSIPISTRVRPSAILFAAISGAVLSMAALTLSTTVTGLWIGTIGLGATMAAVFPTLMAFTGNRMALSGRVTGVIFSSAALGGMILPWLVGQLFVRVSPRLMMVVLLVDLIAVLGVFSGVNLAGRRAAEVEGSVV
jgi:FHS family Na+ dependent glucose MFS transporter 1